MEFVKAWFGCFEIKVTNVLSVLNGFVVAIHFLVDFQIPYYDF